MDSHLRSEHITKQSPTLKGSARPLRSWQRTWNENGFIRRLSGMTLQPSRAMSLAHSSITSTLLQQDSLANPGPQPETEKELKTIVGSGLSFSDWFARYDPEASSWKTSQASFMEELNTYSETWPRSGSMRNGQVFEHQTLARPIVENGFLSWPTADTNDRNPKPENHRTDTNFDPKTGTGRHSISLGQVAANWSTPRANDSEKRGNISNDPRSGLPAIAQHWATPTTQEIPHYDMELTETGRRTSKDGTSSHSMNLEDSARIWATPESRDWKGHTITENYPEGYNHALPNDVAMWMTPAVMSANDKFKNMPTDLSRLSSQGAAWSTPVASDDGLKVSVTSNQPGLIGDADRFIGHPLQTALIGNKSLKPDLTLPRLNPQFVEWLMGWPEGWLDPINSESSETE